MYHIKSDKRSIQSGEWIYTALAIIMQEKKYSQITVTELVEKAKLGRATFYRNFDLVDDVLRMKCDQEFSGLHAYLMEYYKSSVKTEIGNKAIFLKPFLRYWYLHSSVIELLIKADKIEIINDSFVKLLKKMFSRTDSSHGVIWEHPDYFIAMRRGIAVNILIQWINNGMDISPDELADLIVNQMLESQNLSLLL